MKLLRPLSAERCAVSSYSSPKNRRFALSSTGETGPLKSTSSCLVRSLRQAFATLGLVAGINPKVVSEALGHSSVTITLSMARDGGKFVNAAYRSGWSVGWEPQMPR